MHDICLRLLPLLEPIRGHALGNVAAPTYIERFLDVCRLLNQGSTDSAKLKRIVHPHTEKVQVLSGIFADMDVIAAMYAAIAPAGPVGRESRSERAGWPASLVTLPSFEGP